MEIKASDVKLNPTQNTEQKQSSNTIRISLKKITSALANFFGFKGESQVTNTVKSTQIAQNHTATPAPINLKKAIDGVQIRIGAHRANRKENEGDVNALMAELGIENESETEDVEIATGKLDDVEEMFKELDKLTEDHLSNIPTGYKDAFEELSYQYSPEMLNTIAGQAKSYPVMEDAIAELKDNIEELDKLNEEIGLLSLEDMEAYNNLSDEINDVTLRISVQIENIGHISTAILKSDNKSELKTLDLFNKLEDYLTGYRVINNASELLGNRPE